MASVDRRVRRRDDHVREPVAREVGHRHHPVAEESVRPLAVPGADPGTGRARPHRGAAVLQHLLLQLEAGAGGDVRVAVAVDVERLAEAETRARPSGRCRGSAAPRTSRYRERYRMTGAAKLGRSEARIAEQQRRRARAERRRRRHAGAGDVECVAISSLSRSSETASYPAVSGEVALQSGLERPESPRSRC